MGQKSDSGIAKALDFLHMFLFVFLWGDNLRRVIFMYL